MELVSITKVHSVNKLRELSGVFGVLRLWRPAKKNPDFDTIRYWRKRGGRAGRGSLGRLAAFKAEVINQFVNERAITSVIEWGCGDGVQFSLLRIPNYVGVDVSEDAITSCRTRFAGRSDCKFYTLDDISKGVRGQISLSLDVIYHLIEDDVFDEYMHRLFSTAERFVIIYSSNRRDWGTKAPHVRHRIFTNWIAENAKDWELLERIPNRFPRRLLLRRNRSFCDFFIFVKT